VNNSIHPTQTILASLHTSYVDHNDIHPDHSAPSMECTKCVSEQTQSTNAAIHAAPIDAVPLPSSSSLSESLSVHPSMRNDRTSSISPSVSEMLLSGRERSPSIVDGQVRDRSGSINSSNGTFSPPQSTGIDTPASSELRHSSARKRTYSFSATPHELIAGTSVQPTDTIGSIRRSARKLNFGVDQHPSIHSHSHTGFLTPPSPAARAYTRTESGQLKPSPSPPPPASALMALTALRRDETDPFPISSQEILLEEEEEEDDTVIDEAGEQRQWRSLSGAWAMISLLLNLAWRLILSFGLTTKWLRMLFRLICFSVALAPAWYIIGRTYFTAKFIKRGVRYGLLSRNFLDIYLPHEVAHKETDINTHLCDRHRAERSAGQRQRASVVARLPLVGRHLNAIMQAVGKFDAQRDIDENAANEVFSSKSPVHGAQSDVGTRFAAAVTSNAERPAALPPVGRTIISPGSSPTTDSCCASPAHNSKSRAAPNITVHGLGDGISNVVSGGKQLAPVVIFLTGGAWAIGYKAWGALLGLGLSAHGVLVCSVDYRNFPGQAHILHI
jgi:hypothetical protein